MKYCIACGSSYPSVDRGCAVCGSTPCEENGFDAYAPDLMKEENGFKADFYEDYAYLEDGHFWFRARRQLIIRALRKYCPHLHSFFEVGCGTGYVLEAVASVFQETRLCGSEMFTSGLRFAAGRLPEVDFIQMDAREIPFIDEFDAVGAFDVLEHIEEDDRVLMQMHRSLKRDGVLFITVPQHMWLWSGVDEHSCHVRRYSSKELYRKVEGAGFKVLYSTSFVSILLPALVLSRLIQKNKSDIDTVAELKISPIINRIFGFFMSFEGALLRLGVKLPVGGSRLLVARKE